MKQMFLRITLTLGLLGVLPSLMGCKAEPPQTLPSHFEWGRFENGGESHSIALKIEQDGHDLKGRYLWIWSGTNRHIRGDFTGYTAGDKVALKLQAPEDFARSKKISEVLDFELTYGEASPREAKFERDMALGWGSIRDTPSAPEELRTRKIMKLSGAMRYKLGDRDRVANGYVTDIAFGPAFRDEE